MKRNLIGIFINRVHDQNAIRFISEIREAAKKRSYRLLVFTADSDEFSENMACEQRLFIQAEHLDLSGILVFSETIKDERTIQAVVDIGLRKRIPVFSVDREWEACSNVTLTYENGFEDVVRHVVCDHGARRVNMIAGLRNNSFSDERIAAYRKVLAENGIEFEPKRLGWGDFWDRPTRKVVSDFLLDEEGLPDAIVCANDTMAMSTCSVLRDHGISVPEDVIVTGFDGTQTGEHFSPTLTTAEPDYKRAAEDVLTQILAAEQEKGWVPADIRICYTTCRNQSCGCAGKSPDDNNEIVAELYEDVSDTTWHTLEMKRLLEASAGMTSIEQMIDGLQECVRPWSDHFRFVCVKTELMNSYETSEEYTNMTTLVRVLRENFRARGTTFDASELMPGLEAAYEEDGESILAVHLLNTGRHAFGYTIEGISDMGDRHLRRFNEFAMFLSLAIGIILRNRELRVLNQNLTQAYEEISAQYLRDAMTGIYNRRGFYRKLQELLDENRDNGGYVNLFSIDMDGLKMVNDTYGHGEGDFAINTLANAIADVTGLRGVCARFGGDEFISVLLTEQEGDLTLEEYDRKLKERIAHTPHVEAKPYPIRASVGMSGCPLKQLRNAEDLIKAADERMYEVKGSRRR